MDKSNHLYMEIYLYIAIHLLDLIFSCIEIWKENLRESVRINGCDSPLDQFALCP